MLDGLEAVELKLSEVLEDNETLRIDSEYFKKSLIDFYKNISDFEKLGSFVKSGYRVVYENTKILNISKEDEHLYTRFLQASDLLTPEIIMDNIGFVDNSDWERYPKGRIEKGELLIEVKGKAEKVAIVYDDIPEKILVSGSLFKLKVNNKILREYLLAFLLCKYGSMFKDRSKTNLLISYISKPDLYNIPIPSVSNKFQNEISKLIKQSHIVLKESKILYKEAEELLLKELDLLNFAPSDENISIKSFKDSFMQTGRLDSEYYQTKYDEIEKIISEQRSFTYIKNEFNHIKTSFDKSKNGYNYIEIGNVNVSDGTNVFNYVETQVLPANAKINVKNGDLLVSTVRPYRGAVTIIDTSENDLIVSGAFTVLRKKENSKINTQVLQVLLRTNIYKELLLKYNVGTSYPVIKDDDVLNLVIPIIDISIQNRIEEKIKKSFLLKEESKRLLDLAKKAVEIAIEKDENEAVEFINEQI